jgi:hypothetical protein
VLKPTALCARSELSTRDALLGAGVMLAGSALFSALGIAAQRGGLEPVGDQVLYAAFPVSVLLSLPFTYLKGRPWQAQLLYVAVPMLLVVLIGIAASSL